MAGMDTRNQTKKTNLGTKQAIIIGAIALWVVVGLALMVWLFTPHIALGAGVWLVGAGLLGVRLTVPARMRPDWLNDLHIFAVVGVIIALGLLTNSVIIYTGGLETAELGAEWLFAGGLALIGALLHVSDSWLATRETDSASYAMGGRVRFRWLALVPGIILLWMVAEINGRVLEIDALTDIATHLQFVMWVGGVTLVGFGLAGRRISDKQAATPRRWPPRGEFILLGVILLAAFILRVYQLEQAQRFLVDEIHFVNPVIYLWLNGDIGLFQPFSSIAAFPYTYPYLQMHTAELIGHNLAGLRLPSSLFGVLNVWALYLLARALFGGRVALMAAVLLAVMPVHLQYSRIGLNNIADPFFGTMALYFLAVAWREPARRVACFAWAGVMVGLTQYWYEGGRFLFPALAVAWMALIGVMAFPSVWRQNAAPRYLRALVVFALGAVLVGAPIYYTLNGIERPLAQRLETAGLRDDTVNELDGWQAMLDHTANRLNQSFLIHVSLPEEALYYGGDEPLIPRVALPFFMAGVFYALWLALTGGVKSGGRGRAMAQAGALLLLMWIAATWAGNMLMAQGRISARYVVEFPALALVTALGIDLFVAVVVGHWPRVRRWALVGVVGALAVWQVNFFFGEYMERFNVQSREEQVNRELDVEDAIYRSVDFEAFTRVFVVGHVAFLQGDLNNLLRFFRGDRDRQTVFITSTTAPIFDEIYINQNVQTITPNAFFIAPDNALATELLTTVFPEIIGPFYTTHEAAQSRQYALYYLPALTDDVAFDETLSEGGSAPGDVAE
ncbi:MAG: hypothetical protein EA396_07470 [Anaerolineaceae bacterium]|nr:MAG: hypothetical protein EA396_07470 [Anaerolineaceae bacterium]